MLLSGAVRSGTKEPYRNHICIQDELRWRVGGSTALLPYTEQLHLHSLSFSPSSLFLPPILYPIYCLPLSTPPSTLSTPTPPTFSLSQHGSPCIVFPESSKVNRSLLIRAGYCTLSAGMGELICLRECVHDPACVRVRMCVCVCVFVHVLRLACVSIYV